jgi:hypothetical protein
VLEFARQGEELIGMSRRLADYWPDDEYPTFASALTDAFRDLATESRCAAGIGR